MNAPRMTAAARCERFTDRKNASLRTLRARRRAEGVCILNATHGPSAKGGRCISCWEKKLAGERPGASP